jgi:hypothetical protein
MSTKTPAGSGAHTGEPTRTRTSTARSAISTSAGAVPIYGHHLLPVHLDQHERPRLEACRNGDRCTARPALRRSTRSTRVPRDQNPARGGAGPQGIAGTRASSCSLASHALPESGSGGGSTVNFGCATAIWASLNSPLPQYPADRRAQLARTPTVGAPRRRCGSRPGQA